jgi:hypothetical protein
MLPHLLPLSPLSSPCKVLLTDAKRTDSPRLLRENLNSHILLFATGLTLRGMLIVTTDSSELLFKTAFLNTVLAF